MTYNFLRVGDVAARFAVSPSLVYRWVREGYLPPPKLPRAKVVQP